MGAAHASGGFYSLLPSKTPISQAIIASDPMTSVHRIQAALLHEMQAESAEKFLVTCANAEELGGGDSVLPEAIGQLSRWKIGWIQSIIHPLPVRAPIAMFATSSEAFGAKPLLSVLNHEKLGQPQNTCQHYLACNLHKHNRF